MTKEEFVDAAVNSGYCTKEHAEGYVKQYPKDTYDTNDFIASYRYSERMTQFSNVVLETWV